MKKIVEKEVNICDVCGKEDYCSSKCLICGFEACYDCKKTTMTEFNHAVHFSGSNDGDYCNKCLSQPIPQKHEALLQAYRNIKVLRNESVAWNEDFKIRSEKAEARVEQLI